MRHHSPFPLYSWRHQAVALMATAALILAMCDAATTPRFLLTKAAAAALALATWRLARRWTDRGYLDDVTEEG